MPTTRDHPKEKTLRADAQRNLELVLKAAGEAFAEQGLEVGVADIARRAGVGTGTIFRRFPTKDDLIAAVFERRLEEIVGAAREGLEMEDAEQGLRHFLESMLRLQLCDRGCMEAASGADYWQAPPIVRLRNELLATCERLLERAKRAGAVREEAVPQDLVVIVNAVAHAASLAEAAAPGVWRRYLTIALDGLRPRSGTRLEPDAPTIEQIEAVKQRRARR